MERRIVIATDLQDDSQKALYWLLDNVVKAGDDIHVVHVAKLKVFLMPLPAVHPCN